MESSRDGGWSASVSPGAEGRGKKTLSLIRIMIQAQVQLHVLEKRIDTLLRLLLQIVLIAGDKMPE